ncbi:hypothetical protein D3C75_1040950 [compost metagenome]
MLQPAEEQLQHNLPHPRRIGHQDLHLVHHPEKHIRLLRRNPAVIQLALGKLPFRVQGGQTHLGLHSFVQPGAFAG